MEVSFLCWFIQDRGGEGWETRGKKKPKFSSGWLYNTCYGINAAGKWISAGYNQGKQVGETRLSPTVHGHTKFLTQDAAALNFTGLVPEH